MALVVKRPLWYRGDILPRSREFHTQTTRTQLPKYDLNGHELDEIINEKLTNPDFVWDGKDGLISFLGLGSPSPLKEMILTWNGHKIRFAHIAPDTPGNDSAIGAIAGRVMGARCWQRYRLFIEEGGCPLSVDPAILFRNVKPEKAFRMPAELSCWSRVFRRVEVGTGGVMQGQLPQDTAPHPAALPRCRPPYRA
jgi:hypothetical protein